MSRDIDPPLLNVVEGWTKTLGPFTILEDGQPLNLTGCTVTLILHRASGALVTPGGTVTLAADQVAQKGQLYYTPVAADFIWETNIYTMHQPYQMHWKILEPAGSIPFAPSAGASIIMVHRA